MRFAKRCLISDIQGNMEKLPLGTSELTSSRLIYGCMRLSGLREQAAVNQTLNAALECGYNHFDHADIYDGGECETIFGEWLKTDPSIRENLVLTSKCGIRFADSANPGDVMRYDFNPDYIVRQTEGSLKRLQIDTLDLLLLHRPDYLFDPTEVAGAFAQLHASGKVRYFGVSNFTSSQLELLQSACPFPLVNHQVEINLHKVASIEDGTLDQCIMKKMAASAWCPLGAVAYPAWHNTFEPEDELRLKKEIDRQADAYEATPSQIALAWILRLPSKVLPIIGSTKPERIREAVEALEIEYTKEDWYRLLEARNGHRLP